MAVDVRDEGVDKRCRLRRIGAVAAVRDALERATLLQADVNMVDLAGIVCDIVNVLGKFRSIVVGCLQKIHNYLNLE